MKMTLDPQHIEKDVWYYVNKSSVEMVVYVDGKCKQFKIRGKALKELRKNIAEARKP